MRPTIVVAITDRHVLLFERDIVKNSGYVSMSEINSFTIKTPSSYEQMETILFMNEILFRLTKKRSR